jgi:hypothetical protein
LLGVLALALVLRLGLVAVRYTDDLRSFQSGDYKLYYIGAEHIKMYGNFNNSLFLVRPPLFPIMIYALNLNSVAVLLVNAVLGAFVAPFTCILARRLRIPPIPAVLAGLIVALDPASVVYSSYLGAESLATLAMVLSVILLLQAVGATKRPIALAWAIAAAIFLSLSALARPAAYLLWIVLALGVLLVYRQRWQVALLFSALSLVGVVGWIVYNGITFGNYTYSTIGVYNLLYYRAASVEHTATNKDIDSVYTELSTRVEKLLGHDTSNVDSGTRQGHYAATASVQNAMITVALDVFASHPASYLATIPVGIIRMYGWTEILPSWLRFPELIWNALFVFGTALGLWYAYRQRQWLLFWLVLLVIVYYTGGTLAVQTSGLDTRMRSMLTPFMAASSIYALHLHWSRIQARKSA